MFTLQTRRWMHCTGNVPVRHQAASRGLLERFLQETYRCSRLDAGVHAADEERCSHRGCIREGVAGSVMRGRLVAQRAVAQRDAASSRHWRRLGSSCLLPIACSNSIEILTLSLYGCMTLPPGLVVRHGDTPVRHNLKHPIGTDIIHASIN